MTRQLCCRDMYKILFWSDGQQPNYSKAKFPSNLNCGQNFFSEMGPWSCIINSLPASAVIWQQRYWSTWLRQWLVARWHKAITWINVGLRLLGSIPVQFHRKCTKHAGKNYHSQYYILKDLYVSARGLWVNHFFLISSFPFRSQLQGYCGPVSYI